MNNIHKCDETPWDNTLKIIGIPCERPVTQWWIHKDIDDPSCSTHKVLCRCSAHPPSTFFWKSIPEDEAKIAMILYE